MFNYSQDGVTITSILDNRRKKKESKYPIKIRVNYRSQRKYYSTGKDCTGEEWIKLPTTKSKAASELKLAIQTSFDLIKKVVKDLISEGRFSLDSLNTRLSRSTGGSVNAVFQSKIKTLNEEERVGSESYYKNVLSSIKKFGGDSIRFEAVTHDWLIKYEKWLLKKDLSYTTVGIYMRALRHIINIAKKDGIVKDTDYPFAEGKYKIPTGEGRKLALTINQVKMLIDYKDGSEDTERLIALWVLSYLVNGANMADVLRFKDTNFVNGEVRFHRTKTIRTKRKKKEIAATASEAVMKIIERFGVPDRKPTDYIFPYLKAGETPAKERAVVGLIVHHINAKLDVVCQILGLPKATTYSARHSFATISKRAGASTTYIQEAFGHPDQKTTEDYLDYFESEERAKNARLLTNFAGITKEQAILHFEQLPDILSPRLYNQLDPEVRFTLFTLEELLKPLIIKWYYTDEGYYFWRDIWNLYKNGGYPQKSQVYEVFKEHKIAYD